eukprot:jgi/Tetstr1/454913/TSEL_041777.t1
MPPRLVPEAAAPVGDAPGGAAAAIVAELEKRLTAQAEALEKWLAGQFEAARPPACSLESPPTNPSPPEGTKPANPAGAPTPEGCEQGARAELDAPDTGLEYVDFAYYGPVIPPGMERPPRDVDEPSLWTVTDDTARGLAEKRSLASYDEYLHMGCYAFFSSCANEAMRGALESLSNESTTAESRAAAFAELRACYRSTHLATEKATRSRFSYLKLTKNGPTATEADRVFAELAHAKFCTLRRIAVSGQLDQLRRAFDDKTLKITLSAPCGCHFRQGHP